MDKEFEDYWYKHSKRLILNAPKDLLDDYLESTRLHTVVDWVCFILPIGAGIALQPMVPFESEILSWGVTVLAVVLLFVLMQFVNSRIQKKKTLVEAIEAIKRFYYKRYKEKGLVNIETWKD